MFNKDDKVWYDSREVGDWVPATVTGSEMKDGQPTFSVVLENGDKRWGWEDQIAPWDDGDKP